MKQSLLIILLINLAVTDFADADENVNWGQSVGNMQVGMQVGLSVQKQRVEVGGPLIVDFHVKNVGDTNMSIADHDGGIDSLMSIGLWELRLRPVDSGRTWFARDPGWSLDNPKHPTSLTLKPGKAKSWRLKIDNSRWRFRSQTIDGVDVDRLPSGKYLMSATFKPDHLKKDRRDPIAGLVKSGSVELNFAVDENPAKELARRLATILPDDHRWGEVRITERPREGIHLFAQQTGFDLDLFQRNSGFRFNVPKGLKHPYVALYFRPKSATKTPPELRTDDHVYSKHIGNTGKYDLYGGSVAADLSVEQISVAFGIRTAAAIVGQGLNRIVEHEGTYFQNVGVILKIPGGVPALINQTDAMSKAHVHAARGILVRIHSPISKPVDERDLPTTKDQWRTWWRDTGSEMPFEKLWHNFDSHSM